MSADRPLVVAVDGPGGAGKTTAARELARRLGVPYLSTGNMYRAVGLRALSEGTNLVDEDAVEALLAGLQVEVELKDGEPVLRVDGVRQGHELRGPEAAEMASRVAAIPAVRRFLVAIQRRTAESIGGVIEGRDIGTRVLPDAPHKFFLDASLEVRARRRAAELAAAGREVDFQQLLARLERRDHIDSTRADSPLTWDESYVIIDTSEMTVDEVVERMLEAIGGDV